MQEDEYLTAQEVADHWGISTRTVYRYIAAGILKEPIKIGKRASRWPKREIIGINFSRYLSKAPEKSRKKKNHAADKQ